MKGVNRSRELLYLEYCHELSKFDPVKHSAFYVKSCGMSVFCRYLRSKYFVWKDIFNEKHELIGFLITARDLFLHKDKGLYICEAYVTLEYRGKGYMKKAVQEVLHDYHGPVYLEIFDRNVVAHRFWDGLLSGMNAELISSGASLSNIAGLAEYTYYIN